MRQARRRWSYGDARNSVLVVNAGNLDEKVVGGRAGTWSARVVGAGEPYMQRCTASRALRDLVVVVGKSVEHQHEQHHQRGCDGSEVNDGRCLNVVHFISLSNRPPTLSGGAVSVLTWPELRLPDGAFLRRADHLSVQSGGAQPSLGFCANSIPFRVDCDEPKCAPINTRISFKTSDLTLRAAWCMVLPRSLKSPRVQRLWTSYVGRVAKYNTLAGIRHAVCTRAVSTSRLPRQSGEGDFLGGGKCVVQVRICIPTNSHKPASGCMCQRVCVSGHSHILVVMRSLMVVAFPAWYCAACGWNGLSFR